MPEIGATTGSGQAPENTAQLTEMLRNKRRQPVDRKGNPMPIRKSGYDALDKNSFLKLLVTQLSKQDPTNPMNDREFISQMAQFSSLEQMNNVANSMNKLRASQANQLIGKLVQGKDFVTDKPIQGIVTKATFDNHGEVFLSVNGRQIKLDDISEVTHVTPIEPPIPMPAGNVSRETLPIPPAAALPTAGASRVKVSPAQAAQVYQQNQTVAPKTTDKAPDVSRETSAGVAKPASATTAQPAGTTTPAPAASEQTQTQKIKVPKGE